jgi:magnesium chelatase subunit I
LRALLDPGLPAIEGSPHTEDPCAPTTEPARRRAAELGDALPIEWIPRSRRYQEKLATPDASVADLVGDLDPIKAATKKLPLDDPEVIHWGIMPRTNRGIFAVNELPDLQARIQVALLDVLEEGDLQIRGFPLRVPLDLLLVFSANPEDYTNRGRIITPLRDRIASQILTHYPRSRGEAGAITRQEAWLERGDGPRVRMPSWLSELVEEVAFQARASELVDQASGVSARLSIALSENVLSNAERRALLEGARETVARVADVYVAGSAVTGKIELVYEGEQEGPAAVARHLIGKAAKKVFDERLPDAYRDGEGDGAREYAPILAWFQGGRTLELGDALADGELRARLEAVPGLEALAKKHLSPDEAELPAAMELVLEGLHQASLLAKEEVPGGHAFRDMFERMVEDLGPGAGGAGRAGGPGRPGGSGRKGR